MDQTAGFHGVGQAGDLGDGESHAGHLGDLVRRVALGNSVADSLNNGIAAMQIKDAVRFLAGDRLRGRGGRGPRQFGLVFGACGHVAGVDAGPVAGAFVPGPQVGPEFLAQISKHLMGVVGKGAGAGLDVEHRQPGTVQHHLWVDAGAELRGLGAEPCADSLGVGAGHQLVVGAPLGGAFGAGGAGWSGAPLSPVVGLF